MRIIKGELQHAGSDSRLAGQQFDIGFRILRDVICSGLSEISDSLAQQINSLKGNTKFNRSDQSLRPGLTILKDSVIRRRLVDGGQGAEWEQLKGQDLRGQLDFMAGVAQNARLPRTIPARIPSFYYDRADKPTYPQQFIRCRLEPVGDIDPTRQQQEDRSVLLRKGYGIDIENQEIPQDGDGVLDYANFPPYINVKTIRGIVATLNGHAANVGIAVSVTPLFYNVYSRDGDK